MAKNRIGIAIFIMLFVSYSYFLQDPWNWNSIPRIALGISLIEDGTLNIDEFQDVTGDRSYYEGHVYSDKAPGMTFTSLPFIAASISYLNSYHKHYKWINIKSNEVTPSFVFVTQIATIFTSGLLTAIAAVALFFVALKLGASLGGATFGALAYGLATPAWGWATAFYGHASAASCLFLGLVAILYMLDASKSRSSEAALGFIAGALLSWAVVIEYTSAPASAVIAIYGLVCAWQWERGRFLTVLAWAVAGAFIFILPLIIYNYAVFGTLFDSGYRYHTTFTGTKEGFYGIESPRIQITGRLLLGIKRGIFWLSPLLLFVPYALYRQWKIPGVKGLSLTIIVIALYYLFWNSGYVYWTGGSATGPRFLTPILPFVSLSLGILWSKAGKYLRVAILVFFVISFFISLASVSVSMMGVRTPKTNIVLDYLIPNFLDANKLKTSFVVRSISYSLNGDTQADLIPLYIILVLGLGYILWELKREDSKNINTAN